MFTHLGNGCPQELPRHDNIIQRVLSLKNDLWICFIADGIHIPFYALKNYIAVAGIKNVNITTDAMAAAGAKSGRYAISNIKLEVGEDRVVREPGKDNFAGSAIDMKSSYKNLIEKVGLSTEESRQLTYSNPNKIFNI
jgi:N-acetylglucosamine-6-phosphate deacetylase